MWRVLFFASLALVVASESPFQEQTEYVYQIYSKTFTGIPKLRQQYAAVVSRGQLVVQNVKVIADSSKRVLLSGYVQGLEHAEYNGDWLHPSHQHEDTVNGHDLKYHASSLNGKHFQVTMREGVVTNIKVDSSLTNDEVNQLKAILSQLQVDYRGRNKIQSEKNQLPNASGRPSGLYYTKEASVTGECQVTYEISPLAPYMASRSYPHWAESVNASSESVDDQQLFQIVKTMDYSECDVVRGFHHGLSGWNHEYNTRSNSIGDVLSRSTVSQIVASGNPTDFEIQYVQTSMRISAAPELVQKQTFLTTANIELVLVKKSAYSSPVKAPAKALQVGNLIYRYNLPSNVKNRPRPENELRQPTPGANESPEHPLLPYWVGHNGHAIYHNVDIVAQIQALVSEIDRSMNQAHAIPSRNVMQNFNTLSKLISVSNFEHLRSVAKVLRSEQASSGAWRVFFDAVTVAGTVPASQLVASAIAKDYVRGNEAIAALVVQPKVVVTPTRQLVTLYLELLSVPTVVAQTDVYWTAAITLADIIGRISSDRRYAQNFYPVDSYGDLSHNMSTVMHELVIPVYQTIVESAFKSGEERHILSAIRAYGNLGHPSYLAVFKKYYENPDTTPFQRAALVQSLDYVTIAYSSLVHPILYKIYQNVAEHPDARSVAVLHLLMTNPDVVTWQKVASFTNNDPSAQVKGVVKHAIVNIARLTDGSLSDDIVQHARAAEPLLSDRIHKTVQGVDESDSGIFQHIVDQLNYARYRHVTVGGSSYKGAPEYLALRMFTNAGGLFKSYNLFENVVSNVGQLLRHFARSWKHRGESETPSEYVSDADYFSFDKLIEGVPLPAGSEELIEHLHNIIYLKPIPRMMAVSLGSGNSQNVPKPQPWYRLKNSGSRPEPVAFQGQFQYPYFGGQRYHAFDHVSLDKLPATIQHVVDHYKNGRDVNFRHFYKEDTVTIAFPLVTGYPFVYTWDSPVVVQAKGKVQIETSQPVHQSGSSLVHIPTAVNVSVNIDFVYSRDHISQAGFVTPFNGRHHVAGHVRKLVYNVPVHGKVDIDLAHFSVSGSLLPIRRTTVGYFSSAPYTLSKDAFSLEADTLEATGAKLIHTRPMKTVERQVGYNTSGLVFYIKGKHETLRNVHGPVPYLVGGVPQSSLWHAFHDPAQGVEAYAIQVSFDPDNSQADGVQFKLAAKSSVIRNRDSPSSQQESASTSGGKAPQSSMPSSSDTTFTETINELFDRVSATVRNGHSTVVQGWVALIGPGHQSVYQAFGTYTKSQPEGIYRVTAGLRRNEHSYHNTKEYCLDMGISRPGNQEFTSTGVKKTLEADREVGVTLQLSVGNDCIRGHHNPDNTNLIGVGVMNQTAEYVDYVLNSVEAQQCKQDADKDNQLSPACRYVINQLRTPNAMKFSVHHVGSQKYVPDMLDYLAWTQDNYFVRDFIYRMRKIEPISGYVTLSPDNRYYDGTVKYGDRIYDIHDYQIGPIVRTVVFGKNPFGQSKHSRYTECVVGGNYISTFDQDYVNRSVGRCVYTAAQTYDDHVAPWLSRSHVRNVTVLVYNELADEYGRAVGIQFYTDLTGKSYMVHMRGIGPSRRPRINLLINQDSKEVKDHTKHVEIVADGVVRMHLHPQTEQADNMVVVDIHDASMRVIFDGETLRIQTDNSYEQRMQGLCGTNDREPYNDRQSPEHCVYENGNHFVESWSHTETGMTFCHDDVKYVRESLGTCQRVEYIPDTVVNHFEAHVGMRNADKKPQPAVSCETRRQIVHVEDEDQTCFSAQPLAVCSPGCQPDDQYVEMKHTVKCYNAKDPVVRLYKQAIAKGNMTTDWYQASATRSLKIRKPLNCVPVGGSVEGRPSIEPRLQSLVF